MSKAIKLNGKASATTPPAGTPPCTPINESPQQSMAPEDEYQHSQSRELIEALHEARVEQGNWYLNWRLRSYADVCSEMDNASKLKPQEQEISLSCNPKTESPVLMDKYMPDIPPTWMECDPIFMDKENVDFDPAMKECCEMRYSPEASKERGKVKNYARACAIINPTDSFEDLTESTQVHNAWSTMEVRPTQCVLLSQLYGFIMESLMWMINPGGPGV